MCCLLNLGAEFGRARQGAGRDCETIGLVAARGNKEPTEARRGSGATDQPSGTNLILTAF